MKARSSTKSRKPAKRRPPSIIPAVGSPSLCIVSPPEAAPLKARLNVWAPVPGLSSGVSSQQGDDLEITVSAEVYQPGGTIWFRAVVDGHPAQPSDVAFKSGDVNFDGIRSFTFVQPNVGAGQHIVEIESLTGSVASIRDRVLTVHSAPSTHGPNRLKVVAAPSGPDVTTGSSSYQDVPHLSLNLTTTELTGMAIVFSAEGAADSGRLLVRALIDGIQAGEVIFAEAGDPQRGGTRSVTIIAPTVQVGAHVVKLQWKAQGGTCRLGDRTMVISAAGLSSQRVSRRAPRESFAITETNWIDLSSATTITAAASVTNVSVSFSGEVLIDKGRLFLRVLIDDEPASPSDVTLIQGGKKWRSTGHVFVRKNLPGGRHRIRVQGKVDTGSAARMRRSSVRILWKPRSGSDFVQPFLGMVPTVRTYRLLVIGFDPVRPEHPRPSFDQIRNTFEGDPGPFGPIHGTAKVSFRIWRRGPNLRDWLAENSGGLVRLGDVRYLGCLDNDWFVAPPERQGNWYWDNNAFELMWKDALAAADPAVDFHSFDTDGNNKLTRDELLVAIVRPQNNPYGTVRGATVMLDGLPTPLNVPILDLYLSNDPGRFLAGVGLVAHETSHMIFGAVDMYNGCPAISSGYYSVMDDPWKATHLDPFEKMKNGLVQPRAIDLTTQTSVTIPLPAVERHRVILLLHDAGHVAGQYFLIENRYPGAPLRNYDGPLGQGTIAIWQTYEDRQLVNNSVICPGDPRFIRMRKVLRTAADSEVLTWADGSPAGFRVSAPNPNADVAQIFLEKI
jgi:M6 family metalloprotease-like protein